MHPSECERLNVRLKVLARDKSGCMTVNAIIRLVLLK